jgi:hypothetical protein
MTFPFLSGFAKELLSDCKDIETLTNILRTVATYTGDEYNTIMTVVSELEDLPND